MRKILRFYNATMIGPRTRTICPICNERGTTDLVHLCERCGGNGSFSYCPSHSARFSAEDAPAHFLTVAAEFSWIEDHARVIFASNYEDVAEDPRAWHLITWSELRIPAPSE